jgi:hypothetical protein
MKSNTDFFFHQLKSDKNLTTQSEIIERVNTSSAFFQQIGRPTLTRRALYDNCYPYSPAGKALVFALDSDEMKKYLFQESGSDVFSLQANVPEERHHEALGWLQFQQLRNVYVSDIGYLPRTALVGILSFEDLKLREDELFTPLKPRLERLNNDIHIDSEDLFEK